MLAATVPYAYLLVLRSSTIDTLSQWTRYAYYRVLSVDRILKSNLAKKDTTTVVNYFAKRCTYLRMIVLLTCHQLDLQPDQTSSAVSRMLDSRKSTKRLSLSPRLILCGGGQCG